MRGPLHIERQILLAGAGVGGILGLSHSVWGAVGGLVLGMVVPLVVIALSALLVTALLSGLEAPAELEEPPDGP